MRIINKYIIVGLVLLTSLSALASQKSSSKQIFKAMEDEMDRSMKELKLEGNETPFYIYYSIFQAKRGKVAGTMGAILESNLNDAVWGGVSVKMGNYALTDEKYTDKVNRVSHNDGFFSMPLDMSYDGIRRSLWMQTNNTYKGAVETYKNKTAQMKRQGISIDDLPSPDYSKEEVRVVMQDRLEDDFSVDEFEHLVKELSSQFKNHEEVVESDVVLKFQNVMHYGLTSEGIKFQAPCRFYILTVNATMLDESNRSFSQSLEYYNTSFRELPDIKELSSDINVLVENMHVNKKADKFSDVYYGPVLFMDDAGVEMCYKHVFKKGKGLIASPRNLIYNKKDGLFRAKSKTWVDYIGKKVVDRKLTFELKPLMSEYKGKSLIGSFSVDMDGLIPRESELLIKDGILNQQIVGRIPTAAQHQSMRHRRFYIDNNRVMLKSGPSVIKISSNEVKSLDELKSDMVEMAKEEGLDYVFVVKPIASHANKAPINYYKVNVNDSSEKIVSGVGFKYGERSLIKVNGLGDGEFVMNSLLPDYAQIENKMKRYQRAPAEIIELIRKQMIGIQGTPVSVICPDALLLESVELSGNKNNIKSAGRVVPNPLEM